ncbi:MAG: hypothetical protein IPJ77_10090 [Planctomycetes bacterium]|nr:hypothetical protein [Planctomycetota bacterium]
MAKHRLVDWEGAERLEGVTFSSVERAHLRALVERGSYDDRLHALAVLTASHDVPRQVEWVLERVHDLIADPRGKIRLRAFMLVELHVRERPELVWAFIERYAGHASESVRRWVGQLLVAPLLQMHFEAWLPRVRALADEHPRRCLEWIGCLAISHCPPGEDRICALYDFVEACKRRAFELDLARRTHASPTELRGRRGAQRYVERWSRARFEKEMRRQFHPTKKELRARCAQLERIPTAERAKLFARLPSLAALYAEFGPASRVTRAGSRRTSRTAMRRRTGRGSSGSA